MRRGTIARALMTYRIFCGNRYGLAGPESAEQERSETAKLPTLTATSPNAVFC